MKITDPTTQLQVLIIMLTRGTPEQQKEAFNILGFKNAMRVLGFI